MLGNTQMICMKQISGKAMSVTFLFIWASGTNFRLPFYRLSHFDFLQGSHGPVIYWQIYQGALPNLSIVLLCVSNPLEIYFDLYAAEDKNYLRSFLFFLFLIINHFLSMPVSTVQSHPLSQPSLTSLLLAPYLLLSTWKRERLKKFDYLIIIFFILMVISVILDWRRNVR